MGGKSADAANEAKGNALAATITSQRDNMQAQVQSKELALDAAKASRQEAFNPYENMTNEFANLGVATQAAEFQAEETDIALANT